jgi:hypothetical protein
MSKLEDLLVPGSTEVPDCICGLEMEFAGSKRADIPNGTEVRHYKCPACSHELMLTVWSEDEILVRPNSGL